MILRITSPFKRGRKKHFKELLNEKNKDDELVSVPDEIKTFDPILDRIITEKEFREALLITKSGKAVGPDQILTEYLKIFGQTFEPMMLKLIRKIFSQNMYPDIWTINFLKPIFKKGLENDTNNLRGLAIGSSLGKLYSHILLNRLMIYIKDNNLISSNQIGFMKNAKTSDHIFLLQTIIEKVVKKNKKNYMLPLLILRKHTVQLIGKTD